MRLTEQQRLAAKHVTGPFWRNPYTRQWYYASGLHTVAISHPTQRELAEGRLLR